ncbi:MAG: flagellar basal body P-ring formation chaperone FlgA [Thermodesulfobacteriota bacterium]
MNPLKMTSWIPRALVLFGCLLGAGVSPAGALDIKVKDQASVSGGTICLRDIATFAPETDPRVETLSRIDVAAAPSPGNAMNLNRSFLTYKIGSVLSGKEDIRLEIPDRVAVQRTAQVISKARMESIFREHVRGHIPWAPEKVVFEKIEAPDGVALPEGKVHWEIWERGSDRYLGHVALTINFFVDGKQVRNVPVSGTITLRQAVLKAARRINPGQVLGRDDVHLVTEQNGTLARDALTSPEEAVGKKAVRSIQAGQAITSQMVEYPPMVKKGSRVVVRARNDLISVTTQGKVMEDGRMGDEVRVVNLSSGREIFATVKGPSQVEVTF